MAYFTGVAIARVIYQDYNPGERNECDYAITKRIIVLFGLVIMPSFLLVILGAWCSMRGYNGMIEGKVTN